MNVKKILLISAFFPPSVGGPATFVSSVGPEFVKKGYGITYANLELYKNFSKLRQQFFFIWDVWKKIKDVDLVVICDTWSVLIPAAFISILRRKKYLVRIGGDFLWESYISRTKEHRKLSLFYASKPKHNLKEKIIFYLTRVFLARADAVIFNTPWQRDIWQNPYTLQKEKTFVVENALVTGVTQYSWKPTHRRTIRCPVRASQFKNTDAVKKVWDTISAKYPDVILSFEYIHPEERSKILSETYAVIQPSISDVAPNLICEAIASGCPFICTQDTGIRNLLPRDIGIYIETKDESEIQNAFESILDINIHQIQVKKIQEFTMERTYTVLANEYENIWKRL